MPAARCASGDPFHSAGLSVSWQWTIECFYKNQMNQTNQIAAVAALSPGGFLRTRGTGGTRN